MAYGARLESVLGESPRGFESPILRQRKPLQDWDVGPYGTTNFCSMCASMCAEARKLASQQLLVSLTKLTKRSHF